MQLAHLLLTLQNDLAPPPPLLSSCGTCRAPFNGYDSALDADTDTDTDTDTNGLILAAPAAPAMLLPLQIKQGVSMRNFYSVPVQEGSDVSWTHSGRQCEIFVWRRSRCWACSTSAAGSIGCAGIGFVFPVLLRAVTINFEVS